MEQLDKVLVVIPAYNEEANIELVVEELIRDYPDLDYVVVNDGSTDGSFQICGEYAARDSRIKDDEEVEE